MMHREAVMWAASMVVLIACNTQSGETNIEVPITNEQVRNHVFLQCMYDDEYFPKHLVNKAEQILLRLCGRIEKEKPPDETALYALTRAATADFNRLAEEFLDADSDIETGARECIAADFDFIAKAYGFADVDVEELISNRDW